MFIIPGEKSDTSCVKFALKAYGIQALHSVGIFPWRSCLICQQYQNWENFLFFSNLISGHLSLDLLIFFFMSNCQNIALFKTLLRKNIFCITWRKQNFYLFPPFNHVSRSFPELPAVDFKELTNHQINNYSWTWLEKTLTWQQV